MTDVIAEVLPQDKEHIVREKQGKDRKVAMIGDGINDAPALARADVGIAIGAGTDVAISSADVVLMKSDLMDAVDAIRLSRRTMRNIRQNLFWAFFYNCIGIPIAAGLLWVPFGIKLSPMIGAAAMSLSSVCVVSNALRLRFFSATPRKTAGTPAVLPISGEKPLTAHKKEENVMEKTIKVEGMMCQHCVAHVKKALEGAAAGCDVAVDLDADDLMVTSGGATLSSISGEGCTMRMSMPWEAAVRASAVVERIGMITMVYVGETLLITPYDDIEFGKYKSNEGYFKREKKLCRLLRNILPQTTFRSIKCLSAARTRSCSCAPVHSWNRFRVSA